MPSPARRAAGQARRIAQRARVAKARVDSIRRLPRSLNNAESSVALQERAQQHIADGTLVMGNMSYYAPNVVKYTGDTGRVIIGNFASVCLIVTSALASTTGRTRPTESVDPG